ncbi:sensor histidine kinase [Luteococcus sp. OSA5]|uniref:sensor histidine kinase n=1 Tax=Luteococcus sp. OSA5 TaxID=3401630 RepID=UPI003B42E9AC
MMSKLRRIRGENILGMPAEMILSVAAVVVDMVSLPGVAPAALVVTMGQAAAIFFSRRHLRLGVLLCGGIYVVSALVEPQDLGVGIYLPLVMVAQLVARNCYGWARGLTMWCCLLNLWMCRRATSVTDWAAAFVLWFVLYMAAWAAGRVASRRREIAAKELRHALERQRLQVAGELHDNVAHDLSLIVMRARHAQLHPEEAARELGFIVERASQANGYLRNLMLLLKPGQPVRPLDLMDALRRAESDLRVAGMSATVTIQGYVSQVPQPVSDVVARVTKEAVNNMVRHASTEAPCAVLVNVTEDDVQLGFTNTPDSCDEGVGLGLTGMRERVEALGGRFDAGPVEGTWMVRASIPWVADR